MKKKAKHEKGFVRPQTTGHFRGRENWHPSVDGDGLAPTHARGWGGVTEHLPSPRNQNPPWGKLSGSGDRRGGLEARFVKGEKDMTKGEIRLCWGQEQGKGVTHRGRRQRGKKHPDRPPLKKVGEQKGKRGAGAHPTRLREKNSAPHRDSRREHQDTKGNAEEFVYQFVPFLRKYKR